MTAPAGYNGADGGRHKAAACQPMPWGTPKKGGLRPPLSFRILIVVRLQQ
jgi:hypothetical protein